MITFVLIVDGVVIQKQPYPQDGFVEAPNNVVCGMVFNGEEYSLPIKQELTFEEAKEALFNKLSNIRFQKEVGGTSFQNVPLKTDRESTAIITAAYITALGDPEFVMNWKVANGVFSTLTAQHIIAIGTVIRNHVQACFNHEMVLSNLIHQANTKAELEAIDLEQGWPA